MTKAYFVNLNLHLYFASIQHPATFSVTGNSTRKAFFMLQNQGI